MDQVQAKFRFLKPNSDKLRQYGFREAGGALTFSEEIVGGQFLLTVTVEGNAVRTQLIDTLTGEPYTLHLVEEAAGAFVGQVREEFGAALDRIAERCFDREIFKSAVTHALIAHVRDRYGDELEYLWEKFPDNAVFRRKDNGKWYGAVLTVGRDRLGLEGEGTIEVLDVRAEPENIPTLVDGKRIFGGWHMNKRHWISLPLDGALPIGEVEEFLKASHEIAAKR